jgi:hypothetical protein
VGSYTLLPPLLPSGLRQKFPPARS